MTHVPFSPSSFVGYQVTPIIAFESACTQKQNSKSAWQAGRVDHIIIAFICSFLLESDIRPIFIRSVQLNLLFQLAAFQQLHQSIRMIGPLLV